MGKDKRHLMHFKTFTVLSVECVLPCSTPSHLHLQNKLQNIYFTNFAFICFIAVFKGIKICLLCATALLA